MNDQVKTYDPIGYDGLSALMEECKLGMGGYVRVENYESLSARLAQLEQQTQWISVETQLPEIKKVLSEKCILEGRDVPTLYRSGEVITFDGKRVSAGIMEWFHGHLPLNAVTHWLPLPAAPTP